MRKSVSSRVKWAGAAVIGAIGIVAASPAHASIITFDVEAVSSTGSATVANTGLVQNAHTGDTVTFNLYAVLHGAQANDGIIQVVANLKSGNGGILGDLNATVANAFKGTGFANGVQTDSDGDTDKDIGSENAFGQGASDATTGNTYFAAVSPNALTLGPVTGTPDANGDIKQLLGTAVFTITGGAGSTTLQMFPHLKTDGTTSARNNQRFVDAGTTSQVNGTGGALNAPFDFSTVTVTAAPEPGSLALLGIGAVGLLARRKQK